MVDAQSHLSPLTAASKEDQVAYEAVSRSFPLTSKDQQAWWQRTGPLLAKILMSASYEHALQRRYLEFYQQVLLPALGPFPSTFHSAITFTGLPLEFSVNYQQTSLQPIVRVSIEPVNAQSGTAQDPCNQTPLAALIPTLSAPDIDGFDPALLNHFVHEHGVDETEKLGLTKIDLDQIDSCSQAALGFDLKPSGISVKGYTFPGLKSMVSGRALPQILEASVAESKTGIDSDRAFTAMNEYMKETDGYNTFCFFSWDCVSPSKSRLKFYGSYDNVTWTKVRDIWTLGNRSTSESVEKGLQYLQKLWSLLWYGDLCPHGELCEDGVLATKTPVIWNYEMKSGDSVPSTKLYFPVQGKKTGDVANAVALFFREAGMETHADSYVATVESYFPGHDLKDIENLISWVSFAYSGTTGVYLSIYYNSLPSSCKSFVFQQASL